MSLTKEQVEARRTGVGGSDAAACVGLDENRTPLQVWEEKLGVAPPFEGNTATELGQEFEEPIARIYARRRGVDVRRVNQTQRHPKHDFMLAHLDRLVVGQKRGLEIKLRSSYDRKNWGESGSDQVPHPVLLQVQHYAAVKGLPVFDVAVAFGTDFDIFEVPADKELQEQLIEQEHAFWKLVLAKTPPAALNLDDVKRLYKRGDGAALVAGLDMEEACRRMRILDRQIGDLQDIYDLAELEVKKVVGDSAYLLGADGKPLATWKGHPVTRCDIDRMKKEAPEIYERFAVTKTERKFLLKKPKVEAIAAQPDIVPVREEGGPLMLSPDEPM